MYLIGIDVGGTNTKFGLINDGQIMKSFVLPTNTFDVIKQVANGAKELIQSVGKTIEDVSGVAVGFPGMIIDSIVKDSPNIGLQDVDLAELLSQELGRPVVVRNDAEMAVLAEHKLGAGQGCNNMVMLTIGTGVGGGIIINNQLYTGNGGAGELGHIVIHENGIKCNCGRCGCAEQYVSLTALDRMTRETIAGYPETTINIPEDKMIDAVEIMKAYKRNDACAISVIQNYIKELSCFILNICNTLRPEKIVIGGGLTFAPEIISMAEKMCKEQDYGYEGSPSVEIVCSTLGNDAGILGAIACFDEEMKLDKSKEVDETSGVNNNFQNEKDDDLLNRVVEMSQQGIEEQTNESVDLLEKIVEASNENDLEVSEEVEDRFSDDYETEEDYIDDQLGDIGLSETDFTEEQTYDEDVLNKVNQLLQKKNDEP